MQNSDLQRAHVLVSGQVQGVFFRDSTRQKAEELGLAGWVKNTARRAGRSPVRRPLRKGQGDGPLVRRRPSARLGGERGHGLRERRRRPRRLRGPLNPPTEVPPDLRLLLDREGVEIAGSRAIDHGTQYDLARDGETAKLNVYHTGKISTGGRASRLRELLEGWRTSQTQRRWYAGSGEPAREGDPFSTARRGSVSTRPGRAITSVLWSSPGSG